MFISVDLPEPDCADDRDELARRRSSSVDAVQHLDRELAGAVGLGDVASSMSGTRRRLPPRPGLRAARRLMRRSRPPVRCRQPRRISAVDRACAAASPAGRPLLAGFEPDTICADAAHHADAHFALLDRAVGFTTRTIARPSANACADRLPRSAPARGRRPSHRRRRPAAALPGRSLACCRPARGRPGLPRRPTGRSAVTGTSTASCACATTKNTCAVICVISARSGFSTSNSAL